MLGLKPIKSLPIREKIAANLREAILSKKIPAGEILTLESTAQELGVSITPTREAFQILARDGLLELEHMIHLYTARNTDRKFKSLQILEVMK